MADKESSVPVRMGKWTVMSLGLPLCFDELDEAYFEVSVPQLPLDWDWAKMGRCMRVGFGGKPAQMFWHDPVSLCLDAFGHVAYVTRGGLVFTATVSGFALASHDVVGLGVDNVGELYVTHNGARCLMSYLPPITMATAYAQHAWSDACAPLCFELHEELLYDPEDALRTPENTPWMRADDDESCHMARLPLAVVSLIVCNYVLLPGDGRVVHIIRVCKTWRAAITQCNELWRAYYSIRWSRAVTSVMRPKLWYTLAKRRAAHSATEEAIENCDEPECPQLFSRLLSGDSTPNCSICPQCLEDVPLVKDDGHLRRLYSNGVTRVAFEQAAMCGPPRMYTAVL